MRVSSAIFTIASGIAAVSAADCAAAGDYDSQGRYSCNPAHQYPNGQSCKTIDGCPLLADASGQPIYKSTCAAPGDYDDKGRYSCNPAHQYPNGQTCKVIDNCPLLCDASGKPIVKATGTGSGNNGKPTDLPIVGAGSVLTGGMAMVAAAVVAAI